MGKTAPVFLPGTLDMLILKALSTESRHGYAIALYVHQGSRDVLRVEEGALYPALHRLELRGFVQSEWGTSENNRRAKYVPPHAARPARARARGRGVEPGRRCGDPHHAAGLICASSNWDTALLALVRRRRLERDLDDELAFHLAMKEAECGRSGVSDPRHEALRRFGNVARLREEVRDMWTFPSAESVWADVRFAGRRLAQDRAFTLVAVTALAFGIATNSTFFALVNAICLRGLPIDSPERVLYSGRVTGRDVPAVCLSRSLPTCARRRRASTVSRP